MTLLSVLNPSKFGLVAEDFTIGVWVGHVVALTTG